MATIDVTFMHPTDGTTLDVTVDDSMTALSAINELINAGFIQRTADGYDLSVKGGTAISGNQTLRNGGAVDKCTVRVVPATDAGATIDVTFMHPTDGTTLDVTVDDSMTALSAINELINAGFIQRTADGYDLSVKGGTAISGNQTLRNGGAVDKCTVRVVPATDAGAFADVRRARLKSDYEQISNMVGPVLSFRALSGTAPYIDSYEITININSIISSTPTYRNKHVIRVDLGPQYPTTKPSTVMITKPQPFHCNWWESGAYCCGTWSPSEKFGDYLVRLMRTLQFDKEITNPNSPANPTAKDWYLSKINSGLFPCDRTQLPDPSRSTFVIKKPPQSSTTFIIKK